MNIEGNGGEKIYKTVTMEKFVLTKEQRKMKPEHYMNGSIYTAISHICVCYITNVLCSHLETA